MLPPRRRQADVVSESQPSPAEVTRSVRLSEKVSKALAIEFCMPPCLNLPLQFLARDLVYLAAKLVELTGKRVSEKVEVGRGGAKDVDETPVGEKGV